MVRPAPAFQAFTFRANGLVQRLITDVVVFPAYDPSLPLDPAHPRIATKALWDTGATKSAVSPYVAAQLKLISVGSVKLTHAAGSSTVPTYMLNLTLPNRTGVSGVLATEFTGQDNGFEVIIGMDVIALGDLSVTHVGGRTCMSFRTPSMRENDYVQEWNAKRFAGVGRNANCPCGSVDGAGRPRKFKDCHMGKF